MSKVSRDDLFGLVKVLVEAGILEETRFNGYKVAIDVPSLMAEIELLRKRLVALEKKSQ